jgi:phosphotransferase system IIA component
LVEVAVHVFHADVKLAGEGVKEDVECGNKVRMNGEGSEEDDLSQVQTWGQGVECLLHGFDRNLG